LATILRRTDMKYLFLLKDKFPLYRVDLTVLFAKNLSAMGHEIDWLPLSKEKGRFRRKEWPGGTAYLPANLNGESLWAKAIDHFLLFLNDLRGLWLIVSRKYDFVQVKDRFISAGYFLSLCRLLGVRTFFWLSYPFPESFLHRYETGDSSLGVLDLFRGRLYVLLTYRLILPMADHVFVQSRQMLEDLKARGVPEEKMTVAPMGVDADVVALADGLPVLPLGDRALVFTGMFYRIRRLDFLFEVLRRVHEFEPQAVLYMVGEAEPLDYGKELREKVASLGLADRVVFTGFQPLERMFQYVKSAAVCLSSYYPPFVLNSTSPTKLIEYMAMGRPTVVTDHPEQKLLTEESGGGLCVPYDAGGMAEAVVMLLRDRETAEEMGRKAREYALSHRSYEIIAASLDRKYRELLDSR